MSRQQERRLDRQLRKLMTDNCSLCGSPFPHNGLTFGGLDQRGQAALVGECCRDQLLTVHASGFYSQRRYDFLEQPGKQARRQLNPEEAAVAIAAYQHVIAGTDRRMERIAQRGGVAPLPPQARIGVLDAPWKEDDRIWFEQHPGRSHRARLLFPGEFDVGAAKPPEGYVLLLLVRQVEPGARLKAGFYLNEELLPLPENEALAHVLFEIASQREPVPPDRSALCALIQKYIPRTKQ